MFKISILATLIRFKFFELVLASICLGWGVFRWYAPKQIFQ